MAPLIPFLAPLLQPVPLLPLNPHSLFRLPCPFSAPSPSSQVQYLVKWKGLEYSDITWEDKEEIEEDKVSEAEEEGGGG